MGNCKAGGKLDRTGLWTTGPVMRLLTLSGKTLPGTIKGGNSGSGKEGWLGEMSSSRLSRTW